MSASPGDDATTAERPLTGRPWAGARALVWPLALGLGVFVLAWVSLAILGPGKVAPLWPANGVILAALLRSSRRRWPLWLAAGFAGILAGGVANGGSVRTTAALGLCDIVEVFLSAWAIRRFGGEPLDLSRLRVVATGGVAAIVSAAIGAVGAGVVLNWLGRPDVLHSAAVWTLANALGQMIGAPIVLALTPMKRSPALAPRDALWALAALTALTALTVAVFNQSGHPLLFLIYAPLLLVVFRLETLGAALGVLLTSALAVAFTVSGRGPLMMVEGAVDRVILLQVFLLAAVVTNFPVAAVLADRRLAEDNERRGAARLRFFSEHSRDVVVRLGLDRRILDVSASSRQFGYAPDELIGRMGADLNHPDDRAQVTAVFDEMIAAPRGAFTREWRVRTRSGDWVWVEGDASVVRDAAGVPAECVLVMRDITERRAAAEAVAVSEARYRLLAENSGDLVLQFDDQGVILYASAAARLFGYRPEDLVGRRTFDFVHPDDIAQAKQAMAAALDPTQADANAVCEWRVRNAAGHYVWVEGNPTVCRDADGRVVAFTDSVRDITRRKALEDDLRRKRAEAEASEAARRAAEAEARDNMEELARVSRALVVGEFAASVAHELNQPIAAIVTNGEASLRWLDADPPNLDEARLAMGRSIRDANRAAAVISRTRGMLAKGPSTFTEVDINASIEDVLLFTETELRRSGVELRKALAASSPHVMGDRIQLQQVALNLIRNSIEAMADNGARPRILTVATETDEAGQVVVRVEDTGRGLEPDAAPRLFDSFFTTKLGGVGLGLPISRSIIEAHGGRLWASPRPDGGVAFQFTLPAIGRS